MKWKSYLANEHSEQIFLQLNLLFRASALQNTSSASNVNRKCEKKKSNKSSISSLFISNLNQATEKQESDPIASWEIWHIFERESLPPNNLLFSYKSLTSLESCTKSCPGIFNFRWNFHKCRLKPGETRPIYFTAPCPWTTNCQQLESSIWTKFVTFTVLWNWQGLSLLRPWWWAPAPANDPKHSKLMQFGLTFKVILQTTLPIRKQIQMRRV